VAEPKSKRVQCLGYSLTVTNDPDEGRNLALIITAARGKQYELRVNDPDDQPGLVMQMFHTLKVWPGRTFFITVDGDDEITGFSQT